MDLYWPQWLLIIEVDSDKYHGALSDREHDAERQRGLEAAGYTVVRVGEFGRVRAVAPAGRDVVVARLQAAVAAAQARETA